MAPSPSRSRSPRTGHGSAWGWGRPIRGQAARLARIDGAAAGSALAFSEHLRVVWLTPDLDGLFRGAAGDRRRFLDRLVLAVDPAHATRSNALERALRSRNRILEESPHQTQWLDAVEREIAELGVAVAAARAETVARLTAIIAETRDEASPFPMPSSRWLARSTGLSPNMPRSTPRTATAFCCARAGPAIGPRAGR